MYLRPPKKLTPSPELPNGVSPFWGADLHHPAQICHAGAPDLAQASPSFTSCLRRRGGGKPILLTHEARLIRVKGFHLTICLESGKMRLVLWEPHGKYSYVHLYSHIGTRRHAHICLHVYTYRYIYIYICVCVCVYHTYHITYVNIYIYIYIPNNVRLIWNRPPSGPPHASPELETARSIPGTLLGPVHPPGTLLGTAPPSVRRPQLSSEPFSTPEPAGQRPHSFQRLGNNSALYKQTKTYTYT